MEDKDLKQKKMANKDVVSKRFQISQESYKAIKIKAIKLELDEDGKITPKILGETIDAIIAENEFMNKFREEREKNLPLNDL
ncbi:hypothetical protein [Sulfurimonas sp.]|uniref:hypothetical protein n=1 Tax=Sulfurimonas sp. TaxID=2022749 RepID=UPI0025E27EAA|nr:hypothetical protein [Sulfurimonas sp.]MBW6487526.1 hypothetical protein [Sulfurimonas sp.]